MTNIQRLEQNDSYDVESIIAHVLHITYVCNYAMHIKVSNV